MFWKSSIIIALLVMAGCKEPTPPAVEQNGYYNPAALIEAEELRARLMEPGIKIIDFRPSEAYAAGHILGALQLWRSDIEDSNAPVKGMMAGREAIEQLFSRLGIRDSDTLIVYDDRAECDAARLWWVLRVHGFEQARLLNGGLHAWMGEDGALTTQQPTIAPTDFRLPQRGHPENLIAADSLILLVAGQRGILIDARSADEFSGKRQKEGAARSGHIPGSHHRDWAGATNYNGDMKFRDPEALQKIYAFLPEDGQEDVITYCHSGVRSAHTLFVLTQLLGYPRVRNFDGSWIQWSAIDTAPIIQDQITQISD